jgi:uncharacterized repeat protein (TIGR01451 family)
MIGFKKLAHKITNLLLALFIISAQLFAPISAIVPKATAAVVPSNQTAIDSFPFNLGNGAVYSEPGGQPTAAGSFSNGNVGPYVEGACIPSILEIENNSNSVGDIPVSPIYDFLNDDTAINNLEMLGDSATPGNALDNPRAVADNLNDYTYPGTPLSAATSFYSSNGTVTATSEGPYGGNNDGTAAISNADTFRHYNLVLKDVEPNETVYVIFCARLGLDASEYNGSSLSIRTAQGGQENIPIPVNALLRRPSLTITKVVVGGAAQPSDFSFNVSPAINGQSVFNIPSGQNSVLIDNIFPDGSFIITENSASGYTFTSGTGTNCTFNGSTATATVVAAKNPTNASCTFTNSQVPGKIIVVKQTLPDGDPQSFGFTASYDNDGFSLSDGQSNDSGNLAAGSYSVSETVPTGWDLTNTTCLSSIQDTESAGNLELDAGETITCTFTNTKRGHLIVQKTTNPAQDPTVFTINTSGNGTITGGGAGTITDAADHNYEVTPGTYSVSETLPAGWSKDESACQNVSVAAGATVYCTITNTKLATLRIIKDALPNHSDNFAFITSALPGGGSFTLDDDSGATGEDTTYSNLQTFSDLTPDVAYSVTESSLAGWQLTDLTCDTGSWNVVGSQVTVTPTAGQTITCTFENTKLRSISGIKYEADADGGLGSVLGGWTIELYLDGNLVGQTTTDASTGAYSFTNLLPGNYTLQEVLESGWTQIFAPDPVDLTYEADSTGNDFGNFQNGSVSGYKWNDIDGDGGSAAEDGEPKLTGWTIKLFRSSDNTDGNYVEIDSTVTDANGNYSFTNLSPLPSRFYAVCEVQQVGWIQTAPQNNACRYFEMNLSGESNTGRNFGNQGRGTITVVKNVDTDGDGQINDQDVTTWTWDIDAAGNFATGSGNSQGVAAGTYTVSEDQQTNYHVTASSCSGETAPQAATTSLSVTVSPGENVTCTFTNTRDTGTIEVIKNLNPTDDDGTFDLRISGVTKKEDASHGDTTGAVQVVTGNYDVSELAGDVNTSLSDYSTTLTCTKNGQALLTNVATTDSDDFSVATGDTVVCTFTNTRLGHIVVEKQTDPDGSTETFEFDTSYDFANFTLSDGQQNDSGNLLPGTYSVAELAETGWDLTSVVCSDQSDPSSIDLNPGETVTCVFTNTQDSNIIVVKQTDPDGDTQSFSFTASYDQDGFSLSDGQQNDSGDLDPGTYSVSETVPDGWELDSATCSDQSDPSAVSLQAGETVTCTFNNQKDAKIIVVKQTDPDGSTQSFDFTASYDGNGFSLSDGQSDDSGDLDPGTYSVSETVPDGWELKNTTCDDGSSSSEINLSAGEIVTCTFTNEQDAHIIVVKQTNPDGSQQSFNFTASYDNDGFALSDGQQNDSGDLDPGTYSVGENVPDGWDLESATCDDQSDPSSISLSAGETVTCTFTNEQDANIIITKQTNPDGHAQSFSFNADYDEDGFNLSDGQSNDSGDLDPGTYSVSENVPAGWSLESAICDNERDPSSINLNAGETVNCTFTNLRDASLLIEKSNNRPNPTVVGDTVTYTLTVTVPFDSGPVYDATVTDLPPEGFNYIPGSETVSKPGAFLEHPYASPGIWSLGDLFPGDVVVLTYKTLIANSASAGTYPDLAFAEGCDIPVDGESVCSEENTVLANVTNVDEEGTPFVGTEVTIKAPQVLAANTTVLVNTGAGDIWRNLAVGTLLMGVALATLYRREKKGYTL